MATEILTAGSPADFVPEAANPAVPAPVADVETVKNYVLAWRRKLSNARIDKRNIWNECWQLYRGTEDYSDKQDWQSKIALPKAFNTVKQATNIIKRLLSTSKHPWRIDPVNPDDMIARLRAEQKTELVRYFLDKAGFYSAFGEGLECGFILGLGVWKLRWTMKPRTRTQTETAIDPASGMPVQQLIRETISEGCLDLAVVDPYNFYWLPGSKLNSFVGTIEDVEMPKWRLLQLAAEGMFGPEGTAKVKALGPMKIDEADRQSYLRWTERPATAAGGSDNAGSGSTDPSSIVKLTEYFGPIVEADGTVSEPNGHVVIANDSVVLKKGRNGFWHGKPPYVAFSPLMLPFRTEGVGLVEMVRAIDRALNKLANLSVDTLLFRLMPVFEMSPDAYENPEDFQTGLTPGKIFRRNVQYLGQEGLRPIEFADISQGAIAVQAALDRAHQEGALVSEIQQALPRYRGVQTATETEAKQANQDSFFGSMAVDIEKLAVSPLVEMADDLISQFLDTAADPRVASILGMHVKYLQSLSREEVMEMVTGDYIVKATGISEQLEKAEMLQNLVQFMNLVGQNPQAWVPYINQDVLLRRVLEAFGPSIRDIEDIVAPPDVAAAKLAAMQAAEIQPQILAQIPAMLRAQQEQAAAQAAQAEQAMQADLAEASLRKAQAEAAAAEAGVVRSAESHQMEMLESMLEMKQMMKEGDAAPEAAE